MIGAASPWGRSPVDCTDAIQWRCHNYSCGRVIGPTPTDRPRSISRWWVSSLMTLEECKCTSRQWSSKNGYKINTLRMSSLYVTLCGQTIHDSRLRVCSTCTSHLWPRVNPHALRERVYQVHFSVSPGTSQCSLTGWLHNDRGFMKAIMHGTLEAVALAVW